MSLRPLLIAVVAMAALSVAARAIESQAARDAAPAFQVDPAWPKLPKQWSGRYLGLPCFINPGQLTITTRCGCTFDAIGALTMKRWPSAVTS